jgi:hypothetical protein
MALRANWYNLNSGRRYPLDDKATGTDDTGTRLHNDILVDCHLRFPVTAGRHAFLSGLTVTDSLVTAVFLGSLTTSTTRGNFVPLGAVTTTKPVDLNIHYPIQPLYPGVGGFIAFGDVSENFTGRFSTPLQGLLAPRCARSYNPIPVSELRKLGVGTALTGLVSIIGEDDVEVVKETITVTDPHTLEYETVDALVIRLRQLLGGVNVLEKYIGPCGNRPESRNCQREGIELINDARPDCDGNIDFDFRNMIVGSLSDCAGFLLDVSVGMDDACRDFVPDRFQGRDLCLPSASSSSLSSISLASVSSSSSSQSAAPSESARPCFEDSICTSFEHAEDKWLVWSPPLVNNDVERAEEAPGVIDTDTTGPPTESCFSLSSSLQPTHSLVIGGQDSSIWLLRGCEDGTPFVSWDRLLMADMQWASGPAGLVLGWHLFGTGLSQAPSYHMVYADYTTNSLQVWWYPGKEPPVLVGERSFLPYRLRQDYWYRWRAHITKYADDPFAQVIINVSLECVNDDSFQRFSFSFATRRWEKFSSHGVGAGDAGGRVAWLSLQ